MRLNLERVAYGLVNDLHAKQGGDSALVALAEFLPLVRAHGLSAAVNYARQQESPDRIQQAVDGFVSVLSGVCAVSGNDDGQRAAQLTAEPSALYRVHTRLALRLADHCRTWLRAHVEKERPTRRTSGTEATQHG